MQLERARAATEAGDYRRAESIYRELVELRPDDADMLARLGDVLALQERVDLAIESYRRALEKSPQHAAAHYGLGTMLNKKRAYGDAEEHYRKALEARPDHVGDARQSRQLGGVSRCGGRG